MDKNLCTMCGEDTAHLNHRRFGDGGRSFNAMFLHDFTTRKVATAELIGSAKLKWEIADLRKRVNRLEGRDA
jgi:hypothetical protein